MPSKQPSEPPQSDITRTIAETLLEFAATYENTFGDTTTKELQDAQDEAVHKLVTLYQTEMLELTEGCRWSKIGKGAKGSIMWSQALGHDKAIDAIRTKLKELSQ